MDIMHKFYSSRFLIIHESSQDAGTLTESTYWLKIAYRIHWILLEQLERLLSEDTPCRLMTTQTIESYLKVKRRQSQSYKFKEFAKILKFVNFETSFTRDTPSENTW